MKTKKKQNEQEHRENLDFLLSSCVSKVSHRQIVKKERATKYSLITTLQDGLG